MNEELKPSNTYSIPDNNMATPMDAEYAGTFSPFFNGQTQSPPVPISHGMPTFGETFLHEAGEVSDLGAIYRSSQNQDNTNPLNDPVPTGWTPESELANLEGLDPEFKSHVLAASSPQDSIRRHYQALSMQETKRYYQNGSMTEKVLGGVFGVAALSPSTYLALGFGAKSIRLSDPVLETIAKGLPGVAMSSAVHNAVVQGNETKGSIENWMADTYRDTIFGTVFLGALSGLGHGFTATKMWNARMARTIMNNNIELKPMLAEDGSIERIIASPQGNVGAAEVDFAQKFADSSMAQTGLFGVPIIGKLIGKGAGTFSPIVRMMNSRYTVTNAFVDRIASHGIFTKGNAKGIASPEKFDDLLGGLGGDNRIMIDKLVGMHRERNGIDPRKRMAGAIQEQKMRIMGDENYASPEQFMDEITGVTITGNPSEHGIVNEAAQYLQDLRDQSYKELRAEYNYPEEWLKPRTSENYMNRVYDIPYMKVHQTEFTNTLVDEMVKDDAIINSHMKPIRDIREQIKLAQSDYDKAILKAKLKTAKESLQNRLRVDDKLDRLVHDVRALSADEANELKTILKPLNLLKKEMEKVKSDKEKYKIAKDKYDTEFLSLKDKALTGKISRKFFENPEMGEFKFKNPSNRLKFRETHESLYHMRTRAEATYHTIMNQTAEDTIQDVMGVLMGHQAERPLMERTNLIRDEPLYQGGFLSKKLGVNTANYRIALGRLTFAKRVFKDLSVDGGIEPVIENLRKQFLNVKAAYVNKLDKLRAISKPTKANLKAIKEAESEIIQAQKDFETDKQDINLSYNKMMGRASGTRKQREFTAAVRAFGVSTKLGNVPLTMVVDTAAIPMKHGLWPSIRDGLMPALANIKNLMDKGKGQRYISEAPHWHMGLNDTITGHVDRNWGGSAQPYEPMSNRLVNGAEKMAHISQNIAGTNQAENFLQEIVGRKVQSSLIQNMMDFKAGKLSKRDKEKLLIWGIQPEKWADRFLAGFKETGSDGNGFGGHKSWFWKWSDKEAANKFAHTVMVATKDTILRKGMLDAPFLLDDPLLGTLFMFKGWTFASLNRYLVPVMQRPDSEKLIGTMLMLSMGALVDPLRKIARGENPISDDDNMFWNAFSNGGVTSFPAGILEYANAFAGGHLLGNLRNDKNKNRTIVGTLAGPIGGQIEDLSHILRMAGSGNYNQNDMNKVARNLPLISGWQFWELRKKMVESLGLPQNYNEAKNQ